MGDSTQVVSVKQLERKAALKLNRFK